MRGRFGVLSWIFSLAGALLGSQLVAAVYDNVNGPMERALWGGAVFLAIYIGGFAGLSLSLRFGRWRARRPRSGRARDPRRARPGRSRTAARPGGTGPAAVQRFFSSFGFPPDL